MVFHKQNYFQRRTKPKGPKTNERIRSPQVQVISSEGKNLGTLPTREAIDMAKQEVHQISSYIQSTDDKSYLVSDSQALETLESPACLGDMLLTCFNDISRNRQFGLKLGVKIQMQQLLKDIGTVEGFLSTKTLYNNKNEYHCGNIVFAAYKILYQSENPIEVVKKLLN